MYKRLPKFIINQHSIHVRTRGTHEASCPICGFRGFFKNFGTPPRLNALCPSCGSLERHRLFFLFLLPNKKAHPEYIQPEILHFAPEPILEAIFRPIFGDEYRTADLNNRSDLKIDIENIQLESSSYSTIICLHVLEHVDDTKALSEMYRIMKQDSFLILAFPIIEGWDTTYENAQIDTAEARRIHFGQDDHIKYYGKDVKERIERHGFRIVQEITGSPKMCIDFHLQRGEKLFICKKD